MREYLVEYEVLSNLTLAANIAEIVIAPKSHRFRATVGLISVDGENAKLLLRLFFLASSIQAADTQGKAIAEELRDMLSLNSGAKFERPLPIRVIDWSPDAAPRQATLYLELGALSKAHPVLDQVLADGVAGLMLAELKPYARNALGWYRDGILGTTPDRKVQAFWLCLETLAGGTKWTEKVADQCQTCRTPLYCPTCEAVAQHKPFASQKIQLLLKKAGRVTDESLFDEALAARNIVMHGGTLIGRKGDNPFPYAELVDRLAKATRECLLSELLHGAPFDTSFTVLEPSSFNHRIFRVQINGYIDVPLTDDGQLLVENIPKTSVRVLPTSGGMQVAVDGVSEQP